MCEHLAILKMEKPYRLESGEPIADPAGYELVHPNGKKEQGTLQGGSFARTGVADGEYRMKFKHIESAQGDVLQISDRRCDEI